MSIFEGYGYYFKHYTNFHNLPRDQFEAQTSGDLDQNFDYGLCRTCDA